MRKLIAYHNNPAIKEKYLDRVTTHERLDNIIQNYGYWNNGKGCAVGCTLERAGGTIGSGIHGLYESELGIPRILARLEDGIFEALPSARAKTWPREFLSCIKPGADLTNVWPAYAVWLMTDAEWGVLQYAKTDQQRDAIKAVADMYRNGWPDEATARKVYATANAAANAAAYANAAAAACAADAAAAANNAAANAANAAANAAELVAANATANAAELVAANTAELAAAAVAAVAAAAAATNVAVAAAAAAAAQRLECRVAQADKLLELMSAAPVLGVG